MKSRLDLHDLLLTICPNVYFVPPKPMSYPCIRYKIEEINNNHADNLVYNQQMVYQLTVIDEDPDSDIVSRVSQLSTIRYVTSYISDNLNHTLFVLHY